MPKHLFTVPSGENVLPSRFAVSGRSRILLAPPGYVANGSLEKTTADPVRYQALISDMQRLRGRIYLKDGAIRLSDLTDDGRHVLAVDSKCWHLLTVDKHDRTLGCARLLQHPDRVCFRELGIRDVPLAHSNAWSEPLSAAIEGEIESAHQSGFSCVEIGGWALDQEIRCTSEAVSGALAVYAWARLVGGALGISTATARNGSASILRRLGGRSLEWKSTAIPMYFDPEYRCSMEILLFDSRSPNPRYETAIQALTRQMAHVPVIVGHSTSREAPNNATQGGTLCAPSHNTIGGPEN